MNDFFHLECIQRLIQVMDLRLLLFSDILTGNSARRKFSQGNGRQGCTRRIRRGRLSPRIPIFFLNIIKHVKIEKIQHFKGSRIEFGKYKIYNFLKFSSPRFFTLMSTIINSSTPKKNKETLFWMFFQKSCNIVHPHINKITRIK